LKLWLLRDCYISCFPFYYLDILSMAK
jgi:hypothetical protein